MQVTKPIAAVSRTHAHGHRGGVWWANPLSPVLFVVIPTTIAAWAIPPRVFFEQWHEPKYFGFPGMFRALVAALALCIGALAATRGRLGLAARSEWPTLSPVARQSLRRAFFVMYRLTVVAYVLWVAFAVQRGMRPATLFNAVRSQNTFSGELKVQFQTVTGVTTFTQLGISASVVGALLTSAPDRGVTRRLCVLVALAVARGFFLAERLAIIEVVLPWLVVRSGQLAATRSRRTGRFLVRAGPVLAIPLLLVAFSSFEYSRSWSFAKTRTNDSFVEYSFYRISGYYVTSYNNGELYRLTTDRTDRLPFNTVEFVWNAPVIASLVTYQSVTGQPGRGNILAVASNPEYNSPGGLASAFVDFGDVGGVLYFALVGVVLGALYRSFAGSRLLGLLLYPAFFTGVLELPRYLYWAQGRATPAYAALLLTGAVVATRARSVRAARTSAALV